MTTPEVRIDALELQLRKMRRTNAFLMASLIIVVGVAAQGSVQPFACTSLEVRTPSNGKLLTKLAENGDVEVGANLTVQGKLTVGQVDIGAGFKSLADSAAKAGAAQAIDSLDVANCWVAAVPEGRNVPALIRQDLGQWGVDLDRVPIITVQPLGIPAKAAFLLEPEPGPRPPRKFGKRVIGAWVQQFNAPGDAPIAIFASGSGNNVQLAGASGSGKCGLFFITVLYVK
jgi:hypothetical protein